MIVSRETSLEKIMFKTSSVNLIYS